MNFIIEIKKWWNRKKNDKFETREILIPKNAGKWDYASRIVEFDLKCNLVLKTKGVSPEFYFDARHWYGMGIQSDERLKEIKDKQLGILFTMTDSLSNGSSTSRPIFS